MFTDGLKTKVMAQNIEILDFCSRACREQYYFGL